jgi:hypothetical protein
VPNSPNRIAVPPLPAIELASASVGPIPGTT